MPNSPQEMGEAVIRNLENRTGRDIRAWVKLARASKLKLPNELRKWLKAEHGLGVTTCYVIAHATLGFGEGQPSNAQEFLEHQFREGRKALKAWLKHAYAARG